MLLNIPFNIYTLISFTYYLFIMAILYPMRKVRIKVSTFKTPGLYESPGQKWKARCVS